MANERKPVAPKGNIKTQTGQVLAPPPLCKVGGTVPSAVATLPAISETVSLSPSSSTPDMATDKGVVEVKVNVKVGPRRRTEIIAKLAEMSGQNRPVAVKIRTPVLVQ